MDYNLYFCRDILGQIKSDILKCKLQTLEAFLNLEYTTSLHFLQQQADQIKILGQFS
jgi:hypothetical protein